MDHHFLPTDLDTRTKVVQSSERLKDPYRDALTAYEINQVREFLKAIELVRRTSEDRPTNFTEKSAPTKFSPETKYSTGEKYPFVSSPQDVPLSFPVPPDNLRSYTPDTAPYFTPPPPGASPSFPTPMHYSVPPRQDVPPSFSPSDNRRSDVPGTVPYSIPPQPGVFTPFSTPSGAQDTLQPKPTPFSVPHHQDAASSFPTSSQARAAFVPDANSHYLTPSHRTSPTRPMEIPYPVPQDVGSSPSPFESLPPPGSEAYAPSSVVERLQVDVKKREKFFELYNIACEELNHELVIFENLFKPISEVQPIIENTRSLGSALHTNVDALRTIFIGKHNFSEGRVPRIPDSLLKSVVAFHKSLHDKIHTFSFREVKKWETRLKTANSKSRLMNPTYFQVHAAEASRYDEAWIEVDGHLDSEMIRRVTEELRSFAEKMLPSFVSNEEERVTTRYVNMTTIATFFSSVTATTLQFSFSHTDTKLGGAVNLFWFISLVFSVSSGVSSLLGMTWRKSTIFEKVKPPRIIGMWLDKAPMVFLIIAAFTFVVGLNLFAFLSVQPRYVSIATNVFTGLHILGIATVMMWFLLELKAEKKISKVVKSIPERIQQLSRGFVDTAFSLLRRPFEKMDGKILEKKLENLRRNILWASGFDDRVLQLNLKKLLERRTTHHTPYRVANLIRQIGRRTKKMVLGTKLETVDIESTDVQELSASASGRGEHSRVPLKAFRKALESNFRRIDSIDEVMRQIEQWESNRLSDWSITARLECMLWGYPELIILYNESKPIFRGQENGSGNVSPPVTDHFIKGSSRTRLVIEDRMAQTSSPNQGSPGAEGNHHPQTPPTFVSPPPRAVLPERYVPG